MQMYTRIFDKNRAQLVKLSQKHPKEIFYDIADKILLLTKNISTDQLFLKLDDKIIYTFQVIRK